MKAAVVTEFNRPWIIKEVPDPKPKGGQVVIEIRASGMCGTDLHAHHGHMQVRPPFIAGHEPVGTIVEAGAGVSDVRVGDRVGVSRVQEGCGRCRFCQQGRSDYCPDASTWADMGGGNAELMPAWATGCTLIPDGIHDEVAAPI